MSPKKRKTVQIVEKAKPNKRLKQQQKVEVGSPDESRGEPVKMVPSPQKETKKPPAKPSTAPAPASPTPKTPKSSYELFVDVVKGIPEDKAKLAESMGIPVRGLLQLIGTVTLEIKEMKEALPEAIKTKMSEAINEARAQQKETHQERGQNNTNANPQGSANVGQLMQFLPQLLGLGGRESSNPLGDEITKKVLAAGLDQMFAGTELLKAMQKRLMTEMGVKTVLAATDKQ